MAEEKVMEEKTGENLRVNFETRIEVLGGGNVDYGRYPAVPLRSMSMSRQAWSAGKFVPGSLCF